MNSRAQVPVSCTHRDHRRPRNQLLEDQFVDLEIVPRIEENKIHRTR